MTIKNGWYRHFKGGYYYVVCMSRHSETLEDMVVYYHKDSPDDIWVRPASMWEEIVNGKPFKGENMEQLISIIVSVMLVTMCISGILTIAVFWYLVLSRLFDGITGVIPTDKQVEDMTK